MKWTKQQENRSSHVGEQLVKRTRHAHDLIEESNFISGVQIPSLHVPPPMEMEELVVLSEEG